MHQSALRDPYMPPNAKKHKFGVTCHGSLFVGSAPGPLELEK
jgi:hypothetical protein